MGRKRGEEEEEDDDDDDYAANIFRDLILTFHSMLPNPWVSMYFLLSVKNTGYENFTSLKEAYVGFENGSFNGQIISLGSTAQFIMLEPDGHLKVYEWRGFELRTVADLLMSTVGECGYPMAFGKYSICSSNRQFSCFETSSNVIGKFKHISYKQPNLGCSLVTPISCNYSEYHSLLELKNIDYFNLRYNDNQLDEKTGLEDCKSACWLYSVKLHGEVACYCFMLFSLINDERGWTNNSVFLKVQNSPIKQSSPPIDFPRKKSRSGTIVLGSSLRAFFGICLLVGSCIFVFKMKREPEEGGFGSVFQGTLSNFFLE